MDSVREQYEAALMVEREARQHLYDKNGHLLPLIKGPDGEAIPNPYLSEWHRAVQTVRSLARELEPEGGGGEGTPLTIATGDGDVLGGLDALSMVLAEAIERNRGHGLAALSREYRETVMAAREIRDSIPTDDRMSRLVAEGAARAHRLGISVVK